jgi:hypothetical protein
METLEARIAVLRATTAIKATMTGVRRMLRLLAVRLGGWVELCCVEVDGERV